MARKKRSKHQNTISPENTFMSNTFKDQDQDTTDPTVTGDSIDAGHFTQQTPVESTPVPEPEPQLPPTVPETPPTTADAVNRSPVAPTEPTSQTPEPVVPPTSHTQPLSTQAKTILKGVEAYALSMGPNCRVSQKVIVQNQMMLLTYVTQMLNSVQAKEFMTLYGDVLEVVNKHRSGAFHEARVFRCFDSLPANAKQRQAFESILHVMITTCEKSTRKSALKTIDLSAAMAHYGEEAKQKIFTFYH